MWILGRYSSFIRKAASLFKTHHQKIGRPAPYQSPYPINFYLYSVDLRSVFQIPGRYLQNKTQTIRISIKIFLAFRYNFFFMLIDDILIQYVRSIFSNPKFFLILSCNGKHLNVVQPVMIPRTCRWPWRQRKILIFGCSRRNIRAERDCEVAHLPFVF